MVDISFLVNDVAHVVRRRATGELSLKIGESLFRTCTEENVRELLPVRAYSQKQLSAVGARLEELRRFVQSPIQAELDSLQGKIIELGSHLRMVFEQVVRYRALRSEIAAHDLERRSVNEQIEKLRSSLKGLSEEDRTIIARQSEYELEQRTAKLLENAAETARETLDTAVVEFNRVPASLNTLADTENRELLEQARTALVQAIANAQKTLSGLQATFTASTVETPLAQYFAMVAKWHKLREAHHEKYENAKTRSAAHEQTLQQIRTLEARLAELNEIADIQLQQVARLGDPAADFTALRVEWKSAHRKRGDFLEKQCEELTTTSNFRLRAILHRAADTAPLADKLKQLVKGTKTRGERIDALAEQISGAADPVENWDSILDELQELAWMRVEDEVMMQLPPTPRLDSIGFTTKEKGALARQLKPQAWVELLLFDLKDSPSVPISSP